MVSKVAELSSFFTTSVFTGQVFLLSILPSELELLKDSVADDKTLFQQISILQKRKSEQICILQKSKSVTVSQFILVASKRFSEGMRNGQGGR